MGTESSVKRLDAAGGKDVRTLEVTAWINGVQTTVEMQVVAIADEQGRLLSFGTQQETLEDIRLEMRLHTEALLRLLRSIDVQQETSRDELLELISEGEQQQ